MTDAFEEMPAEKAVKAPAFQEHLLRQLFSESVGSRWNQQERWDCAR